VTKRGAHPVAELFPMLPDDELRELAEDVKQRGLLHPIVLDVEGRILDGRNRHAACLLVGVEPTFETFDGADPAGYALAVNLARRNLSTGARAIIAARAARLNGQSTRQAEGVANLQQGRVSQANVVLDWAPDLADAVVTRGMPFSAAVDQARTRKQAATSEESKLAEIRTSYPELADRVSDEELTLTAALVEVRERQAAERRDIEQAQRAAETIVTDTQTAVVTILLGVQRGAGGLVTNETIGKLREAIDQLEDAL
jgi:hypothetical protein